MVVTRREREMSKRGRAEWRNEGFRGVRVNTYLILISIAKVGAE